MRPDLTSGPLETQADLTFFLFTCEPTQVGLKTNDVKCPFKDVTTLLYQ